VRFYDPDRHIIEVGENMVMVVKRFLDSGLPAAETAARMDVTIEYVKSCIVQRAVIYINPRASDRRMPQSMVNNIKPVSNYRFSPSSETLGTSPSCQ
jgi:hypothetical protein